MTTATLQDAQPQVRFNADSAIVIPVINEEKNVRSLIFGISDFPDEKGFPGLHDVAVKYGKHIAAIFVDDSEHDLTGIAIKKAQYLLDEQCGGLCPHLTIQHEHRTGAMCTGRLAGAVLHGAKLASATYGAKKIIVMDGDLQHNPLYIPGLLKKLDDVDLVATTRYHKDGSAEGLSNLYRKVVSRGATYLVKGLFAWRLRGISDPMTGFYGFRSDSVSLDKLDVVGFKVLFATLKANPKLSRTSIPFKFGSRLHGESKGDLKEGIDFLKLVIKYRLQNDKLNFVVGGGLIGFGGIYLLKWLVQGGLNAQAAYSIMLAVTLAANFLWNRFITWRDQDKARLHQQIGAFVVTRAVTLGGSWLTFWILVSHFGMHYQLVNVGCMLFSTAVNYVTSKRIFGI